MLNRYAKLASILVLVVPAVIYIFHALTFGSWIIDDAGITFAYARNFVQGHGLVSQPGMPPVEGYSNFTWLVLLSPFFLLPQLDPAIPAKAISIVLVLGTFGIVWRMLRPLASRDWIVFTGLTLTALNTSFVMWTISGLENPLYLFLASVMLWRSIRLLEGDTTHRNALVLGVLAALISMTRPDGLAYLLTVPVIVLPARHIVWKLKGSLLLRYSAAFIVIYGLFIAFRMLYFGMPMPNTYYMKGGPELQDVINLVTLRQQAITVAEVLFQSVFGYISAILLILIAAASLYVVLSRQWTGQLWAIFVFLMCSFSVYLLLPPDWMPEYRFATIFFPLLYLYAAIVGDIMLRRLPRPVYVGATISLAVIAITATFILYVPRTEIFRRSPAVAFQGVRDGYATKFNWYKDTLGLDQASVLLPDVGGMLYDSRLTVYDIAGLTDQTIARTLGKDIDFPGFYDYVFETIKPTFIHIHGSWTMQSQLTGDPRFLERYVPICAYEDAWIEKMFHLSRQSGDFVAREIAEAHPDEIRILQAGIDETCGLN